MPDSPRGQSGATKHILADRGHLLIGVDMFARRPVAVLCRAGELVLAASGLRIGNGVRAPRVAALNSLGEIVGTGLEVPPALLSEPGAVQVYVMLANAAEFRAWIVDGSRQLWELSVRAEAGGALGPCSLELRDRQCTNFTRLGCGSIASWYSDMLGTVMSAPPREWTLSGSEANACVFAIAGLGELTLAYPVDSEVRVHGRYELTLPRVPGQLIGLVWRSRSGLDPTAHPMFVAADRRRVFLHGLEAEEELFVAPAAITEVRYEPGCRKVVYRTQAGALGVYGLDSKAVVWQAWPDAVS